MIETGRLGLILPFLLMIQTGRCNIDVVILQNDDENLALFSSKLMSMLRTWRLAHIVGMVLDHRLRLKKQWYRCAGGPRREVDDRSCHGWLSLVSGEFVS